MSYSNGEELVRRHHLLPGTVIEVTTVDEIVAIVQDTERYPSPVRAVGSNHSTTACGTGR